METKKQLQTFISYSRINQQFATKLACGLKSAGFDIWMDQFDIPTGTRWDDEIEKALQECEIFLIIMTPASITSENAKDEVGYAIDHGKFILPVLLEDCTIPLRLRRMQYVDFRDKSFDEGLTSAKGLLSKLVNESELTVPEMGTSENRSVHSTAPSNVIIESKTVPTKNISARHQAIHKSAQKKNRPLTLVIIGGGTTIIAGLIIVAILLRSPVLAPSVTPTITFTFNSPTETVMATSTAYPTDITITQTPALQRNFIEEFGDDNQWDTAWVLQFRHGNQNKQNSFKYQISDGDLIFDLTDEYVWGYFMYEPAFIYSNVEIEVVAVDLKSTDTLGLICQFSDQGWYEFDINGGGKYSVRFVDNMDSKFDEERYEIKAGAIPGFKYSTVEPHENIIRASCNKNQLSLSVNDTGILNGYPSRFVLEQGQVGIAVRSGENYPVHVVLRSISVKDK